MFHFFISIFILNLVTMSYPSLSEAASGYSTTSTTSTMEGTSKYVSVDFEVYGRVQGVFFRKYTQKQAQKLGLSGWCMNTESGTVQGNMQGLESKIIEMKSWLKSVGSPQSRIDKAVFTDGGILKQKPTPGFAIRR